MGQRTRANLALSPDHPVCERHMRADHTCLVHHSLFIASVVPGVRHRGICQYLFTDHLISIWSDLCHNYNQEKEIGWWQWSRFLLVLGRVIIKQTMIIDSVSCESETLTWNDKYIGLGMWSPGVLGLVLYELAEVTLSSELFSRFGLQFLPQILCPVLWQAINLS